MKFIILLLLVLNLLSNSECGFFKGLTEALTDNLDTVGNGVLNTLSKVEKTGKHTFSHAFNKLGEKVFEVADDIKGVLPFNKVNKHPVDKDSEKDVSKNLIDDTVNNEDTDILKQKEVNKPHNYINDNTLQSNMDFKDTNNDIAGREGQGTPCEDETSTSCISADMIRFGEITVGKPDMESGVEPNRF